ncbi:hypothetical protein FRC07_008952 [Ceratobasidium sp. 392]|nr:hypothetical protein FRC07_008952 [Ceratobasidium sp. 392]
MIDLSALVLKVGGPRPAFAVAKAMNVPSASTTHKRLVLPQLQPSIGFPTREEILANIHSYFAPGPMKSDIPIKTGVVVMADEIACESCPCYSIKLDAIVGLACENAHLVDLAELSKNPAPLDTLLEAKALLVSGVCHRAKEVTMAAIARFGKSDYNASVILASGTCKTEKASD